MFNYRCVCLSSKEENGKKKMIIDYLIPSLRSQLGLCGSPFKVLVNG